MINEKIVICCDCRNYIPASLPAAIYYPGHRCAASRINYVSNSVSSFACCQDVNKDGHCSMFQSMPPPKPVPVPWWKKLFGGSRGQL